MFFFFSQFPCTEYFHLCTTIRYDSIYEPTRTNFKFISPILIWSEWKIQFKFYVLVIGPWHNVRSRLQNTVTNLSFIPFIIFYICDFKFQLSIGRYNNMTLAWPRSFLIVFHPAIYCSRLDHYKWKKKYMLNINMSLLVYNSLILVLIQRHTSMS